MRFLRSLSGPRRDPPTQAADERGPETGGRGTGRPGIPGHEAREASTGPVPAERSDEAREAELAREFDAGLSDLGRQQLRFASYAWEPPAQLDRRGRWVAREAIEAVDADGRRVGLRSHEELELDEPVLDGREVTAWRFVRVKDGRAVVLEADEGGTFPAGLERPGGDPAAS